MAANKSRKPGSPQGASAKPSGSPTKRAAAPPPSSGTSGVVWLVVGTVLAVIAAVVLVVVFTGDEEKNSANGDDVAGLEQFQPVEVTGAPLEPMSGPQDDGGDAAAPVADGRSFDGTAERVPAEGEPTMIAFGAHWCPHCQVTFPVIVDWMADGGAEAVDVVAVATSTNADRPNYPPSAWLSDIAWDGREVADDEAATMASAYGLQSFPYLVFVDADGDVQYRLSGEVDTEQLDAGVAAITGG